MEPPPPGLKQESSASGSRTAMIRGSVPIIADPLSAKPSEKSRRPRASGRTVEEANQAPLEPWVLPGGSPGDHGSYSVTETHGVGIELFSQLLSSRRYLPMAERKK